jgi:membrane-associated phospholipid phosphatase
MDFVVRLAADWLVVPMVVVAVMAVVHTARNKRYQVAARALAMLLLALLFAKLASLLYTGTRPFRTLGVEPGASFLDNPGFPSDHAVLVFGLVIIVWMVTRQSQLALWMLIAAIVVIAARVLALVHSPLDVIAGGLIAGTAGWCMYGRGLFGRK